MKLLLVSFVISCAAPARPRSPEVIEREHVVVRDHDRQIGLDVVRLGRPGTAPILLVHGAGLGAASFDLPVPGYSLAEDLARAGFDVYALDIRGWGSSTRPPALDGKPEDAPPAVSSEEAVADIEKVFEAIQARHHLANIAILGWATGAHWVGMFAATHPRTVARVVLLNTLYGTAGPWPLREALEEPGQPGRFRASIGAYSLRDGPSLVGRWTSSIPAEDKATWRDPRVVDAYIAAMMRSDPTSATRTPPTARVPSGPLRDSYRLATGEQLWDARAIAVPVLVIRSGLDFWSRPEDVVALRRDLPNATFVEIPDATHFVFLDRAEHGRARFVRELLAFLGTL